MNIKTSALTALVLTIIASTSLSAARFLTDEIIQGATEIMRNEEIENKNAEMFVYAKLLFRSKKGFQTDFSPEGFNDECRDAAKKLDNPETKRALYALKRSVDTAAAQLRGTLPYTQDDDTCVQMLTQVETRRGNRSIKPLKALK